MTEIVQRENLQVTCNDGYRIALRRVVGPGRSQDVPVIMVHGARVPGVGSFDLPVAGGSLAEDVARAGHCCYVVDIRGYGGSTRPVEMDGPAHIGRTLVHAWEAARDIGAVVAEICSRERVDRVALLGWATGAMWCGFYTASNPDRVSHLIHINGLYGGSNRHSILGPGSQAEDPERLGSFNHRAFGAYRLNDAASLLGTWDKTPKSYRDPAVARAYVEAALASDPKSELREPRAFRSPNGAMEDSYYQACGRQLYDAAPITAHVLLVRSEFDFWSRQEDAELLASHLTQAAAVETLMVAGASHFVHLDRADAGRAVFLAATLECLGRGATPAR